MIDTLDSVKAGIGPIACAVAGMLALLFDLAAKRGGPRGWVVPTAVGVLIAAVIASFVQASSGMPLVHSPGAAVPLFFGGATIHDGLGCFLTGTLGLAGLGAVLLGASYVRDRNLPVGEYHGLVLLATAGGMWMVQSRDLVSAFVGLEVLSVALYVLAGFVRGNRASGESAVKYFLLGAFASAFLLYGIVLVYGATGLAANSAGLSSASFTRFDVISDVASASGPSGLVANPLFGVGVALVVVGLGFKASLAPFHHYAPDVYEGAPTPVTAFLATAAKVAAFGVLARLCLALSASNVSVFLFALSGIAVLTMLVGNAFSLTQTRLKRILAGSSVAHAGYLAAGLTALFEPSAQRGALEALVTYLIAYTATSIGLFATVLWISGRDKEIETLKDLDGLAKRQPVASAVLTLLLLSMAGLPPSFGFLGKLAIFLSVVKAGNVGVAILSLLCSAIGIAVYFGVLVRVYFRNPSAEVLQPNEGMARIVAIVAAATVLVWGLRPLPWFAETPLGRTASSIASAR